MGDGARHRRLIEAGVEYGETIKTPCGGRGLVGLGFLSILLFLHFSSGLGSLSVHLPDSIAHLVLPTCSGQGIGLSGFRRTPVVAEGMLALQIFSTAVVPSTSSCH